MTWLGGLVFGLVVLGAVLVAVIGAPGTAALYGTGAVVGGTSAGITFASIPEFFASVKTGQGLVKKEPLPTVKAAPKKSTAKSKSKS